MNKHLLSKIIIQSQNLNLKNYYSKEMIKKCIEFTCFALILSNDVVVIKTLGSSKISSKDLVSLNMFLNSIEVGALVVIVYGP